LAAALAARYPERVEALVVYGMCASGIDLAPAEVRESLVALVQAPLGPGLKALTGAFVTDPTAEEVAAFTRLQRASASAAVAARLLEVYYDTDIRALLRRSGRTRRCCTARRTRAPGSSWGGRWPR
jgi:pimeloyl-ACP methyl ester carboxylesterase